MFFKKKKVFHAELLNMDWEKPNKQIFVIILANLPE